MSKRHAQPPLIIGIGGTLREASSTELAIRAVLDRAVLLGAEALMFTGAEINFPNFVPGVGVHDTAIDRFLEAIRRSHMLVIGSPGYHGGISGLVKNALDYTEYLSKEERPYFDGRPVGCIATGAGWQGANATLVALRQVVHALRGWPTPMGIAANSTVPL